MPRQARVLVLLIVSALLIAGCTSGPRGTGPGGARSGGKGAVYQTGPATYYADRFSGRRTASGERYRPSRLTAAHRELPFGSRVRVTNQDNGRSVTVRINDRDPYAGHRVIDLSGRAARKLRMRRAGVVPVTLEVLSRP